MKDEGWNTILFDLDGTLTDPKVGITSSIRYALAKLERPLSPQTNLDWCIGPPIQQNFATLLATDDPALIDQGIVAYREYFAEKGLLENEVYPDVPTMLATLNDLGLRCYVATSKPTVYARQIVAHFGLHDYFVQVYGSELTGVNGNKGDLIRHLLAEENLQATQTIMVGDRKHDMLGAQENDVVAIGVLYGYGSRAELEESGANFLVQTPLEIVSLYQQMR
jgi:phosphoglycolate phosphatase